MQGYLLINKEHELYPKALRHLESQNPGIFFDNPYYKPQWIYFNPNNLNVQDAIIIEMNEIDFYDEHSKELYDGIL